MGRRKGEQCANKFGHRGKEQERGGGVARGEEPSAEGYSWNLKQATQESIRRLIFERENTIPRVRNYRREYATIYTVQRVV